MTAPAAVSLGARMGWLRLENSGLAFLGAPATPYITGLLALGELVADKLPNTPSRKETMGFSARLLTGAVSGGAIGGSAAADLDTMLTGATKL